MLLDIKPLTHSTDYLIVRRTMSSSFFNMVLLYLQPLCSLFQKIRNSNISYNNLTPESFKRLLHGKIYNILNLVISSNLALMTDAYYTRLPDYNSTWVLSHSCSETHLAWRSKSCYDVSSDSPLATFTSLWWLDYAIIYSDLLMM